MCVYCKHTTNTHPDHTDAGKSVRCHEKVINESAAAAAVPFTDRETENGVSV